MNSSKLELLVPELAAVKAQNDRLTVENSLLRQKLNRLTTDTRSTAAVNVEAKIRAFQLEEECEQTYQYLENLKKRYNKLHEAYCEKVKRCKILENTFQRQKTLTGLVMKSAIKQRNEEQANESLEPQLQKLQKELDEAYDIIDALEFELETVDLLEAENQRLQNELSTLKAKYEEICEAKNIEANVAIERSAKIALMKSDCHHGSTESICEECTNQSDIDNEALERAVLTESVMQNVEMESNMLRRELLKCHIQKRKET